MEHDIAFDLLPLYHDSVCSQESRQAVEAHLKTCETCRRALADMDAPLPEPERARDLLDGAAIRTISREWRRKKCRAYLLGAAAAAAVLLAAGAAWLFFAFAGGSWGYQPESLELTGGQQYCYNPISRQAFAAHYAWDGDPEHMTLRIPDTVFGYPVTSLGGYTGKGVPCAFRVNLPEAYGVKEQFDPELFESERQAHPNAEIIDLTFTVTLGKNVSELKAAAPSWAYCFDESWNEVIYRVFYQFDCDPENETFYSEEGRLYARADGALVSDFPYSAP